MEPSAQNHHLRERKRRSQSPLSGVIFTRSKSQIYVHRNRSGRAYRDASPKPVRQLAQSSEIHPIGKSSSLESSHADIPIKDLRARRVFSTGPARHDAAGKPGHQLAHLSSPPLKKTKSAENADDGTLVEDLRARNMFSDDPACLPSSDSFRNIDGEDLCTELKKLENFGKTYLGSSENVDLCDSDEGHGVMVNENIENFDGSGKTPAENEKEGGENGLVLDVGVDQTKVSNSSSKMVVNLNTRLKAFKATSSFSYRRSLPFLRDIANDESGILKVGIVKEGITDKFKSSKNGNYNLGVNNAASNLQNVKDYSCAVKCKNVSERSDDEKPQNGEKHKVEVQSPTKLQDADVVNNVVNNVVAAILGESGLINGKLKDDENGMDGCNELMGDCVQMTPPDAVVFSRLEQDSSGENEEGKCLESNSTCGQIITNETSNSNSSHESPNTKNGRVSKARQVLNPCSRLKVFKPLGSVSYRRLLPYLTSVEGTNSCVSGVKDQPKKAKKDSDGDQDPALLASSIKDTPLDETKLETSPEKKWTVNEEQYQTSLIIPPYGSADNPSPSLSGRQLDSSNGFSDSKSSSITSSNVSDCPTTLNLRTEWTPELDSVLSICPATLNLRTEGTPEPDSVLSSCHPKFKRQLSCNNAKRFEGELINSAVPSCLSVNHEILPTGSTLEMSLYQPDGHDRDCTDLDNVQLVRRVKQSSSNGKESDEPGSHINGLRRGILKRNPRGCRGLCRCLNCASFRLNAERAFEFSRNQMQDAEEVALELIKEVKDLCHTLERSVATVNDHAVIPLNQLQVEEACRKALETEQLAKQRLSQMNEDLKIHCRIKSLERPRVVFSSLYDEEKVIPPR